jgi:hypothetical protein
MIYLSINSGESQAKTACIRIPSTNRVLDQTTFEGEPAVIGRVFDQTFLAKSKYLVRHYLRRTAIERAGFGGLATKLRICVALLDGKGERVYSPFSDRREPFSQ